jgi:arsenate reductase (glutaredoxin)
MPSMLRMYGIPNCDSVKKAQAHFKTFGVPFEFVDFKKQPPTKPLLAQWCQHVEWTALLNTAGTTFRKLADAEKVSAKSKEGAIALMLAYPSCIKRPVVVWPNSTVTVGLASAMAMPLS